MRLDKLLAHKQFGSRKEVKAILKKGHISVNGQVIKNGKTHVDIDNDKVLAKGVEIHYQSYIYIMLNKPKGVISATSDKKDKTVIDILPRDIRQYEPFPVGRLDKDTEGLLLITNDGKLAHELTSPKKNIEKIYLTTVEGKLEESDIEVLKQGLTLRNGDQTKPAKLSILESGAISVAKILISEGKYHQVKRMFAAIGKRVITLKRLQMGEIILDETLEKGAYRYLNESEKEYCQTLM